MAARSPRSPPRPAARRPRSCTSAPPRASTRSALWQPSRPPAEPSDCVSAKTALPIREGFLAGVSARQVDAGAQAAMRRIFQPDVAAMAARHVAGDREAEPDAAGRRVARWVEPDERLEHPLAL